MAGIYIHVPFCKTRCIYCDFYSTTHSELRKKFTDALCKEVEARADYLKGERVNTLYFGGGTPSQLEKEDFVQIFDAIDRHFPISSMEEITVEANPDDLTEEYAAMLETLPFNRISMGVQSFDEEFLKRLHRRHTAQQAIEAVNRCRNHGFSNISIDLIYGLPGETRTQWELDLEQAVSLNVEHISAYHLIYEEGTPLYQMLMRHKVEEVDEDDSLFFFTRLMERLKEAGYEHYEISNFSKSGRYSRHNSSYWEGIPYLGCGPSAHSFDRLSREWNVPSLQQYIEGWNTGERKFEKEELSTATRYNEWVMTSLRTARGMDILAASAAFGPELTGYCLERAGQFIDRKMLEEYNGHIRLTREGIFISDSIISDLMYVNEE